MPQAHRVLGIVAREVQPVSRWARPGILPVSVLVTAPDLATGHVLPGDQGLVYAGVRDLALHSGDTAHYRDNLTSARPSLWVALPAGGPLAVHGLTADPYEGEAWAGDEGLVVEAVPMPVEIRHWIAEFFRAHHVEHVFEKRRRKPADPEAMSRREPGATAHRRPK
jgi:hypothetical protein